MTKEISARYIELLKKSLNNELYIETEAKLFYALGALGGLSPGISLKQLARMKIDTPVVKQFLQARQTGSTLMWKSQGADGKSSPNPDMRNYTEVAHSMIGRARLDNLQTCIETCLDEKVPGDLLEAGIWRGGATVFMRGVLAAHGVTDRVVWAADSFEGVPPPAHPEDADFNLSASVYPFLAVALEEVQELFARYDLLDSQTRFLKGWFKDTLTDAPIEQLAVLRLDGDLYESTMDALNPLYAKVSSGGFVIIDDYFSCPPCGKAVDQFRRTHEIGEPLVQIDAQSVFWRKA